jgi:transposase
MPISKQRNKHMQQVLVEAAKLAPRYSHELALVYERERLRGNKGHNGSSINTKLLIL